MKKPRQPKSTESAPKTAKSKPKATSKAKKETKVLVAATAFVEETCDAILPDPLPVYEKSEAPKRTTKAPAKKAAPALRTRAKKVAVQYPENESVAHMLPSADSVPALSHDVIVLLSMYIDGELAHDPERQDYVEHLLDTRPDVLDAFKRLKQLQGTVAQMAELSYEEINAVLPDCWGSISTQLEADDDFCRELAIPGESASPEFLAAYYDNELPRKSPGVQAFEAQLGQDAKASKTLGDWLALSQVLKGFIYRLEEACKVELVDPIMKRLQKEETPQVAEPFPSAASAANETVAAFQKPVLAEETAELLSAYFDNDALNPREKAEAARLLETREPCREFAFFHQQLREGIGRVIRTQESQVPNQVLMLKRQLQVVEPVPVEKKNLFTGLSKKISKKLAIATSIAASVLLIAVAGIAALNSGNMVQLGAPQVAEHSANTPAANIPAPAAQVAAVSSESPAAQSLESAPEQADTEQQGVGATVQPVRHYSRLSNRGYSRTSRGNGHGVVASNSEESQTMNGVPLALPVGGLAPAAPAAYIMRSGKIADSSPATDGATFVSTQQVGGTRRPFSTSSRSSAVPSIRMAPTRPHVANSGVPSSEAYLMDALQQEQQRPEQNDVHASYDL